MAMRSVYKVHLHIEEAYAQQVKPKVVRATIRAALTQQKAKGGSLSVTVSGDTTLKRLNKKYLQHNYATDVLSFPSDAVEVDDRARYYGDIVVSYARVVAQAQAGGHSAQAELQLLLVHGVLHLLGYDHYTIAEKKKMWAAQKKILTKLKCEIVEPNN